MKIYGSGILKSMRIAFRNFMRKPITVQYPHEKVQLPERSRWALAMKLDETGAHKCTGCIACERACPDYIIQIELTTAEDRSKHIDHWHYEIGACMMCGLCVEACPYDAIEMSHDYELARIDPDSLSIELLTDTPAVAIKRKAPVAKPAEPSEAAEPAAQAAEPGEAAKPAAQPVTPATPTAPEGGADV
jgi:NADH-quinone oxidoreductase subunit I